MKKNIIGRVLLIGLIISLIIIAFTSCYADYSLPIKEENLLHENEVAMYINNFDDEYNVIVMDTVTNVYIVYKYSLQGSIKYKRILGITTSASGQEAYDSTMVSLIKRDR